MIRRIAIALGVLLWSAVTMAGAADLPPLSDTTPTGAYFPGKFIWADLFTADPAAAQAFYTGLFGWEATPIERPSASGPHTYIILTNGGEPVAGLARLPARMPDAVHGRWVGYVSVPDVAKALEAATAAGGRVLFPAKELPRRGTQAIVVDPEGAELGVLHASAGDPGEYTPDPGDWTWAQLFARDPAAAGRFYASLAGWEVLPDTRGARPDVFVFASGGYSRASLVPLPPRPQAGPNWLLFVRVVDVKAAAAQAIRLGGRVLVPPSDTPTEYWRAVIADPTGAVLGVVQLQAPGQAKEQP
ncbi:MAG TPA: VOC family protein [Candidatus Baltobacteraceae bacterium]|nr:VOC family protein [Candidatus Baltobacteraceae bacterium]